MPSDGVLEDDCVERVEPVDVDGVEVDLSKRGIAPRANEGDVHGDGDGDLEHCTGKVTVLVEVIDSVAAILAQVAVAQSPFASVV